jgi:hypothetical protein
MSQNMMKIKPAAKDILPHLFIWNSSFADQHFPRLCHRTQWSERWFQTTRYQESQTLSSDGERSDFDCNAPGPRELLIDDTMTWNWVDLMWKSKHQHITSLWISSGKWPSRTKCFHHNPILLSTGSALKMQLYLILVSMSSIAYRTRKTSFSFSWHDITIQQQWLALFALNYDSSSRSRRFEHQFNQNKCILILMIFPILVRKCPQ